MAQFTSEFLFPGPPAGQLGYNATTVGVIDANSGQLLKSYFPIHKVQETGYFWVGFKKMDL